jgi:hypothetical protein
MCDCKQHGAISPDPRKPCFRVVGYQKHHHHPHHLSIYPLTRSHPRSTDILASRDNNNEDPAEHSERILTCVVVASQLPLVSKALSSSPQFPRLVSQRSHRKKRIQNTPTMHRPMWILFRSRPPRIRSAEGSFLLPFRTPPPLRVVVRLAALFAPSCCLAVVAEERGGLSLVNAPLFPFQQLLIKYPPQ